MAGNVAQFFAAELAALDVDSLPGLVGVEPVIFFQMCRQRIWTRIALVTLRTLELLVAPRLLNRSPVCLVAGGNSLSRSHCLYEKKFQSKCHLLKYATK